MRLPVFALLAPAAIFFPGLLQNDVFFSGNVACILYALVLLGAVVGWRAGTVAPVLRGGAGGFLLQGAAAEPAGDPGVFGAAAVVAGDADRGAGTGAVCGAAADLAGRCSGITWRRWSCSSPSTTTSAAARRAWWRTRCTT